MKKILLILVAALGITTATAQTEFKKSDVFVEGTATYTKTDGQDATYTLNPTLGVFLTNKLAVGATLATGDQASGKTTSVGAFGRYYFLNLGQNFKVHSQLGVNNNNINGDSYISADFGLGLNYFVTKNLALTTSVTRLASYSDANSNSTFTVGFDGVENPFNKPTFGLLYRF